MGYKSFHKHNTIKKKRKQFFLLLRFGIFLFTNILLFFFLIFLLLYCSHWYRKNIINITFLRKCHITIIHGRNGNGYSFCIYTT